MTEGRSDRVPRTQDREPVRGHWFVTALGLGVALGATAAAFAAIS